MALSLFRAPWSLRAAWLLPLVSTVACEAPGPLPERLVGTGEYRFDAYDPLANRPVDVHYHVPEGLGDIATIVIVLHGQNRNADEYRDAWIEKADEHGFIVAAPEFSTIFYLDESAYQLGNVYVDGFAPLDDELNPSDLWTFSVIEPLFDDLVERTRTSTRVYHLFGHSAGAQFVHRLVQFVPDGRYGFAIAANAGWYTVPDNQVAFPYGFARSVFRDADRAFFDNRLVIHSGSADNDPAASGLRRTAQADDQGEHRFARATHFLDESERLAAAAGRTLAWSRLIADGVDHDFVAMSADAADWLASELD